MIKKPSVGLTKKDLSTAQARETAAAYVERFAEIMDAQIERNNVGGINTASITLPNEFSATNGIESADMQLLVYTDLVLLYRRPISMGGKGFERVAIDTRDPKQPKLIVRWNIGLTTEEREERMNVLRSALVK